MIEVSLENINILYPDGTSSTFESSVLKERIAKACLECNCPEMTIAEDIALAVEFALRMSFRESGSRNIRFRELENAVSSALEEAGFPLVAEKYLLHTAGTSAGNWKLAIADIREFLERTLNLSGEESSQLSAQVEKNLLLLGFQTCSPRLATELARELRERTALEEAVKRSQMAKISVKRKRLIPLSREELSGFLPDELQFLLEKDILSYHTSTTLFPSVRLEIRLAALLAHEKAMGTFPATDLLMELDLYPAFARTASAVDLLYKGISGKIGEECKENCPEELSPIPLILTFPDALAFVRENMQQSHTPEKGIRNLFSFFRSLLQTQPFRIRYNK